MIACFVNAVGALCDLISLRVEPGEAPFVWKHFFGIVGGFRGVVSRRVFRATAGLNLAGSDFRFFDEKIANFSGDCSRTLRGWNTPNQSLVV